MKASEVNFLQFLGKTNTQFIIPIYQRTYSWTRSQCQQLWNDIERVATDKAIPAHFIGSVVYIQEGIYHASSIQQMLVIDGQQRLTSISLLLLALAKSTERKTAETFSKDQIYEQHLINKFAKDNLRYKLSLTRSDKDTLINLIEGYDESDTPAQRIKDNFNFFLDSIKHSEISIDDLYTGIKKLVIVDVSLDRSYDNPQLIFESLNSTGLDLTQADLIRNYILMGLEPDKQEDLYRRYWYPIEERFGHAEAAQLFDRFMRDYLTIKSEIGTIPNITDVYHEFKKYLHHQDIDTVIADIALYATYFERLAFADRNKDKEIGSLLKNINELKVDVAYPLLLEVFDDYERHKLLSREAFIEILQLVENYVVRRAIVGIPTNSMNKTFATFKRSIKKEDYINSVKYAFMTLDGYRRFPKDEEFWDEFSRKDIYNLRQRRNYLLSKLENHDRKEWVNVSEYTIEHILPQNPKLSLEWQKSLGPDWKSIQSRNLHTIGNLTLTGYNSELSDRSFLEKRDATGGFADSPLRLNRGLAKLEKWGEKEISDRAQEISDLALQIWKYPQLDDAIIQRYSELEGNITPNSYSLDHFKTLEGSLRVVFNGLRHQIINLDSSVREEPKKAYIAYKTTTNFVDIIPQKSALTLILNMGFDEISDPRNLCRDVTDIRHNGNGDIEIKISSTDEIEYALFLIKQSFEKHTDQIEI